MTPPITAADVPDKWISDVQDAMKQGHYLLRAGPDSTIHVGSVGSPWMVLMLPGSGTTFATAAERNTVLRKLLEL